MEHKTRTTAEHWSSLEEIARHIGVSKDTIRAWIKKETIPHHKSGTAI